MRKFRFHWGHGIALFYGLFVLVMLVLVVRSFSLDRSLVVDDYYNQDITYQTHKDKLKNAMALEKDLDIQYLSTEKTLELQFPKVFSSYSGTILFYKPDNKKLDFKKEVDVDRQKTQKIRLDKLVSGVWTVKVDWQGDGKAFYREYSLYK